MKKIFLISFLAVLSSCEKYEKCDGKYMAPDGSQNEVYTKKGNCYIIKGSSTFSKEKIDNKYCDCL